MYRGRRRRVGAEVLSDGVSFRVWAPGRRRVAVVIEEPASEIELTAGADDHFEGIVRDASAGTEYRFRLDGEEETYPDPASRFQPRGPHGPSRVIDPTGYRWRDERWSGVPLRGAIIYELHTGTFTPEGTYRAAIERLPLLADVGINVIELLPLHEFPGKFGWGYDGVDLWAPSHLYGAPDDLRAFVDAAHRTGLAVILDVVYNHFGPDGCYLRNFTPDYFTKKYVNDWGEAVNFDGENSGGVREFVTENAAYWIDEFHFDGLRLDATQSISDDSQPNVMRLITECARAAAPERTLLIVAENEPQDVILLHEYGVDAMWNDDWHHAAQVCLTGLREAYYTDYCGAPQEFVSMTMLGFLYQGQRYSWQKGRRGTPSIGIDAPRFILYLQNHDQVANSAHGKRVHQLTAPGRFRALTALLLLSPQTPMLFQGQEFGASTPFLYFADHKPELAEKVREGRAEFLTQFPSIATVLSELADPSDEKTFQTSKLEWSEREQNVESVALHRDLIHLRRTDPTFAAQRADFIRGAVIAPGAFVLRWIAGEAAERLMLVNFGADLRFEPAPEPLLAPPPGFQWEVLWSSESTAYGGSGVPPPESDDGVWSIPGNAAIVLRPTL